MAGRLSDAWLDELRSRLNIVDVASDYVALKQKGRRYWGLCPFHNEKSPSFSVDADAQMYYCFGCHKGGHVIHFVMEMERMDFMEAVKLLSDRARFPLPERDAMSAQSSQDSRALKERIFEANVAAAHLYHDMIWTPAGAKALAYLHKRGLDDRDIRKFGLGATGDGWDTLTEALGAQGFEEDVLVTAGLTTRKETRRYDMFRERVIFPIINAQNRVVGFGGRAMTDVNPKYLNSPDTPVFNKRQGLYAMNFVKAERGLKQVTLVEGYMDVLALRSVDIPGVVATLGTALTEEQARLIKRYAPEVLIAYDGDGAGQRAILRALDIFDAQGVKARVLDFPGGLDPDDFVKAHGAEGFRALKPVDPVEYRMRRAADGLDLTDQEARTQYAIAACGLLKKVVNPVELEAHVERLTIETGFSREILMKQIGVAAQSVSPPQIPLRAPRARAVEAESEAQRSERKLITLLSNRLIPPDTVCETDFDDALYQRMAALLTKGHTAAEVLDRVEEEERARAARAFNDEVLPDERIALKEAEDALTRIRAARVDREIDRMRAELKGAPPERQAELKLRIIELTKAKRMAERPVGGSEPLG